MPNKTILVIDDDDHVRSSIRRLLGRAGFVVVEAHRGDSTLSLMEVHRPDLVLLDIMMPGINGYEVCRQVRASAANKMVKILLMSGNDGLEDRLRGYEAGADDFISKPFDAHELRAKAGILTRLKREEEVSALKGNVLTLFSHETRTPLSVILLASEMMAATADVPPQMQSLVDMVRSSAERLNRFVNKTTLLCDLKRGRSIDCNPASLADKVQTVIGDLAAQVQSKSLSLHVDVDPTLQVEADWTLMAQVLHDLFENAIKFSPVDGAIAVALQSDGSMLSISVSDQGPGIPEEWLDRVFDEFAIQDIDHHQKGQGLSLAIARHVMRLHGGRIEVQNQPEGGARFSLTVPAPAPVATQKEQP